MWAFSIRGFVLIVLVSLSTACGSFTGLVDAGEKTSITVEANGRDEAPASGAACDGDSCMLTLAREHRTTVGPLWSCSPALSDGETCRVTFTFEDPQDIVEMRIAFAGDNKDGHRLKVKLNGDTETTIETRGETESPETFVLLTEETRTLALEGLDLDNDHRISVNEVKFMVISDLEFTYIGCFTDMESDRVLMKNTSSSSMTPTVCATYCEGYAFFATQSGEEVFYTDLAWTVAAEWTQPNKYHRKKGGHPLSPQTPDNAKNCWCGGPGIDYNRHGEGQCDTTCAGDESVKCGGTWAFDLYSIDDHVGAPSADRTGHTSLGCFADERSDRVLASKSTSAGMTPAVCATLCEGHRYYATQKGVECWCGPAGIDFGRHGEGSCDVPCSGDDSIDCGGSSAFNLYEFPISIAAESNYLGCFADTRNDRILTSMTASGDMTPTVCAARCEGYAYYATQYGRECWCGVEGIDYTRHGEATCDRPCTGNNSINCGGTWAFSIYEYVETETNYIGCFKDTYGDRVLPIHTRSNGNSPEFCANYCTGLGMPFFGLQYSRECWCGDCDILSAGSLYYRHGTASCPMACSGDASTSCGGSFEFDLYQTELCPSQMMCDPNPCENGGTCTLASGGGYYCSCPEGYGGLKCQTETSSLARFSISLIFVGTWSGSRRAVFESAASRWEDVVTHVPCSYNGILTIYAKLSGGDGPGGSLGSSGPTAVYTFCTSIAARGEIVLDVGDIDDLESSGAFESVVLREMGHVIGIGTVWDICTTCETDESPDWTCPAAVEVYNNLLGDPEGTEATIVQTELVQGNRCGHFDETTFGDEVMTPSISLVDGETSLLSMMTAAALEDLDNVVDGSKVDAYELPARRSSISAAAGDADATGDDSDGSGNERRRFLVTDTREDVVIDLVSDTGERIGTTRAKRHVMRF